MNLIIKRLLLTCSLGLAAISQAADSGGRTGFYTMGDIGASFVQKLAFDRILGVNTGTPAEVSVNTGVRGTLGIGYSFVPTFAAELETGFSYNETKNFSEATGGVQNGNLRFWVVPVTVGVNWRPLLSPPPPETELETFRPLERAFRSLRPYVGGGIGAAAVFGEIDNPDATNPVGGSGRDTVLTYYVKTGLSYPLNDRTELGVQYRFYGTTGFTVKETHTDELFAHVVSVVLRISF